MTHMAGRVSQGDGKTIIELVTPQPKLPDGALVTLNVVTQRSHRQHRAFWAMLRFASDHSDRWESPEECLLWLKAELGLYQVVELGSRRILHFDSISFREMGPRKFRDLFDLSAKRLAEEIGIDPLLFMEEST